LDGRGGGMNSYEMTARSLKAIRLLAVLDAASGSQMLPKQVIALSDDDWARAAVIIGTRCTPSAQTRRVVLEMARERLAAGKAVSS
jgi:hypothetical protein